jgi:hypothetical protein
MNALYSCVGIHLNRLRKISMTNKEKGILERLRKNTKNVSHKCYNPNCDNLAIRSHIQQVEGAIRQISRVDGKIIQVEDLDSFNSNSWDFKEKGIKHKGDVLTFWGFCNKCDSETFKVIENGTVDYSEYKNQVLFSYRGFLSELNKQEFNLKWYLNIFQSSELSKEIKNQYRSKYIQFSILVKSGRSTKMLLESDLKNSTKHFDFINFTLPRIDICTSTAYSLPAAIDIDDKIIEEFENMETIPPFSAVNFVNIIPIKNGLEVILGCHNQNDLKGKLQLEKISLMNEKDKFKLLSDILIRHIETWFVSKSLFNTWKSRNMASEILKQMEKYRPHNMKRRHIKFNMFQEKNE